jgi:hypothetical protein
VLGGEYGPHWIRHAASDGPQRLRQRISSAHFASASHAVISAQQRSSMQVAQLDAS